MSKPIEIICVFGDSTAAGFWDREAGGWVNRLWLYESKKEDYREIYNLSISGGTSKTILDRFENEALIRKADALLFQTGGNDSAFLEKIGNYWIEPEKFRGNIAEIIRRAKKITEHIVFMGFEGCEELKTMPVSWADVYYTNNAIKQYNQIIKEVCAEQSVPFLDVYELLTPADLEDGVHPSIAGHIKIFEAVKKLLLELKWI